MRQVLVVCAYAVMPRALCQISQQAGFPLVPLCSLCLIEYVTPQEDGGSGRTRSSGPARRRRRCGSVGPSPAGKSSPPMHGMVQEVLRAARGESGAGAGVGDANALTSGSSVGPVAGVTPTATTAGNHSRKSRPGLAR